MWRHGTMKRFMLLPLVSQLGIQRLFCLTYSYSVCAKHSLVWGSGYKWVIKGPSNGSFCKRNRNKNKQKKAIKYTSQHLWWMWGFHGSCSMCVLVSLQGCRSILGRKKEKISTWWGEGRSQLPGWYDHILPCSYLVTFPPLSSQQTLPKTLNSS